MLVRRAPALHPVRCLPACKQGAAARRREASPDPGACRLAGAHPVSPYMRARKPERAATGSLPHRELFGAKGARLCPHPRTHARPCWRAAFSRAGRLNRPVS